MKICPSCQAPMPAGSQCTACGYRVVSADGFELYAPEAARVGDGYEPTLYPKIAALEGRNFWFQARNRLIVRTMRRLCLHPASFLEIGCGTGQVLRAIAAAFPTTRVSGSELFVEGLPFARQRVPGAHLMQMDATRIPYTNEFDAIGAFDVLEHIADDARVITEILRALKPGAAAILTVPQHPWLWSHQDQLAHHQRRYRRGELEHKLRAAGFRVAYSTSFVTLLLPAMLLSRLGRHAPSGDALRELRIGGVANTLLSGVMTAEYALVCSGVRFPLGGSRLVVATKKPS